VRLCNGVDGLYRGSLASVRAWCCTFYSTRICTVLSGLWQCNGYLIVSRSTVGMVSVLCGFTLRSPTSNCVDFDVVPVVVCDDVVK
jgi:hypothetical protein